MQFLRKQAGGSRLAGGRALASLRVQCDQMQQHEGPADRLGHQPGDVALAWLLAQPAVIAPAVGLRIHEQPDAALCALDLELHEPTLARLDEIFPGHRTAPGYYAW
jgi:aryl-alcohol dehydrogenase-like predicted oxidoreductase